MCNIDYFIDIILQLLNIPAHLPPFLLSLCSMPGRVEDKIKTNTQVTEACVNDQMEMSQESISVVMSRYLSGKDCLHLLKATTFSRIFDMSNAFS